MTSRHLSRLRTAVLNVIEGIVPPGAGLPHTIWLTVFHLLAGVAYVAAFVVHGVFIKDLPTVFPFVAVTVLYHFMLAILSRGRRHSKWFQFSRACIEAALVFAAILLLEAWNSHLWLLFGFPILILARFGYPGVVVVFAGLLLLIQIFVASLFYNGAEGSRLISVVAMQTGYLAVMGLAVSLAVLRVVDPHQPIRFLREARHSPQLAAAEWRSLLRPCATQLGANRLRVVDWKAIRGSVTVIGDTDAVSLRHDRRVTTGLHESTVIATARQQGNIWVRVDELAPLDRTWLGPWHRHTRHILLAPLLQDSHLLGFLLIEYSQTVSLSEYQQVLAEMLPPMSSILHARSRDQARALLAQLSRDVLAKGTARDSAAAVATKLAGQYGAAVAVWQLSERDTLRKLAGAGEKMTSFVDSLTLSKAAATKLRSGGMILIDQPRAMGLDMFRLPATGLVLPAAPSDPVVVLTIHATSPQAIEPDLQNLGNEIVASALLPSLRLAVTSASLRGEQETMNRLHAAAQRSVGYTAGSTPEIAAAVGAEFCTALGHKRFAWCQIKETGELNWKAFKQTQVDTEPFDSAKVSGVIRTFKLAGGPGVPLYAPAEHAALTAVPITLSSHPGLCYLTLGSSEDDSGPSRATLGMLQGYLSLLLEQAHLTIAVRQHVRELEDLATLSTGILARESTDEIIHNAADAARALTAADVGMVLLTQPVAPNRLLIHAAVGSEGPVTPLQTGVQIGTGVTGECAQLLKPVVVGDTRLHASYVELFPNILSELAVPLTARPGSDQELLGVLNVESEITDRFSEEHIALLQRLGTQIVIALTQAERIKRLQDAESLAIIGLLYGEDIHLANNRLGAALQFARNIVAFAEDPEKAREFGRRIEDNVSAFMDLIATIRETVQAPNPRPFSLTRLLDDALATEDVKRRAVTIRPDYALEDDIVVGFERQVRQVFRVLINNALGAMQSGGELTVTAARFDAGNPRMFRVTVSDTGAGIPDGLRKSLFSLEKPRPSKRGLGIGLAWSRLFLTMHGGDLLVLPPEAVGTTFEVRLPAVFRRLAPLEGEEV